MAILKKRNWYARKADKPYEDEDNYYINVYSPVIERDLADPANSSTTSNYVPPELHNSSLNSLLSFYGKRQTSAAFRAALDPPIPVGLTLQIKNIYFPERKLVNPIVLLALPKTVMNNPDLIRDVAPSEVPKTGVTQYEIIQTSQIKPFLSHLETGFKIYQQQLQFFNGQVSPRLNFLDLLSKVKVFFDNLENFISFNDLNFDHYQSVKLGFNSASKVIYVELTVKAGHPSPPQAIDAPSGGSAYLSWNSSQKSPKMIVIPTKGLSYYFDELPAGKNIAVNQLVSQLNDIFMVRRSQINWTQFISQFMPTVTVNHFGRPSTNEETKTVEDAVENNAFGKLGETAGTKRRLDAYMSNPTIIERAYQEARKAKQQEDSLQRRLGKITKEIQNATGEINKVSEFLNKYRISALIEAALECLLFKVGFRGEMPDFIPGVDPFSPVPPRLLLRFPDISLKLPIININKQLQAQVEEGLKRAAMQALFGMIEAIADIIRELCLKDDHPVTPTQPVQNAIDHFLSPLAPPGGPANCYSDYRISTAQANLFFDSLSNQISDRETCDLLSGYPSNDVLQIIRSVLAYPELTAAQAALPDDGTVIEFFLCLGSMLDPSYCEGIYNNILPDISDIDPCEIEDQLAENEAFQELLDMLNEVADLTPDMSCGGGIVPAMADVASYNYAVTTLVDSILQPAQQSFITDLGNFKAIVIQPDVLSPANVDRMNEIRALSSSLNPPVEMDEDGDAAAFIGGLIPSQVSDNFSDFQKIGEKLKNIAEMPKQQRLADLQASVEYAVAPKTRRFYQNIEDNFKTSKLFDSAGFWRTIPEPYPPTWYYSFLTDIPFPNPPWSEAFGPALAGSLPYGKSVVYSLGGSGRLGANPEFHKIRDKIYTFTDVVPPSSAESNQNSEVLAVLDPSNAPNPGGGIPAYFFEGILREQEAKDFGSVVTEPAKTLLGTASPSLDSVLDDIFVKRLYPAVYFSLINMFAYQISNSPLFNATTMSALSLFPKFCTDGRMGDTDLFDANQIKREALQEFVDNSCTDRETELGPVRDAGILALVSAYLQVLIMDLLLKNIFVISEFGANFLTDAPEIVTELFSQVARGRDTYGATNQSYARIPSVVRKGAALAVRKFIDRDPVGFNTMGYPITGHSQEIEDFIVNNGLIIPVFQTAGSTDPFTGEYTPPENPQTSTPPLETRLKAFDANKVELDDSQLQAIAIRYLFEKRLKGTQETIKSYFKIKGSNTVENYLLHGIPHVEIPTFNPQYFDEGFLSPATDSLAVQITVDESLDLPPIPESDTPAAVSHYFDFTNVSLMSDAPYGDPLGLKTMFYFSWLNYLRDSKARLQDFIDFNDYMQTAPILDPSMYFEDQFGGSEYLKAKKEIDSILDYGALVAEKYMLIDYNPDTFAEFVNSLDGTILGSFVGQLRDFADTMDQIQEVEAGVGTIEVGGSNLSAAAAPDSQPSAISAGSKRYYMSFDFFNKTFKILSDALQLQPGGYIPIPFALRGRTAHDLQINVVDQALNEDPCTDPGWNSPAPTDHSLKNIYIQVSPAGSEWGLGDDGSDPMKLSDYALIRGWVKNIQGSNRPPDSLNSDTMDRRFKIRCGEHATNPGTVYTARTPLRELRNVSGNTFAGEYEINPPSSQSPGWGQAKLEAIQSLLGMSLNELQSLRGGLQGAGANDAGISPFDEHMKNDLDFGAFGHGNTIFESQSFKIVVRAEKNYFDGHSSFGEISPEDAMSAVRFGGIYMYLLLKRSEDLDGTNSNLPAAEEAGNQYYAPFLDFREASGDDQVWVDNFDIMMSIFDTYRTQEDLMSGMAVFAGTTFSFGQGNLSPMVGQFRSGDADDNDTFMQYEISRLRARADGKTLGASEGQDPPPPVFTGIGSLLAEIFPSIQMGMRLAYLTPLLDTEERDTMVRLLSGNENLMKQQKSYYLFGPLTGGKFIANIATGKTAVRSITDDLFSNKFQDFMIQNGTSGGFARYVDFLFNEPQPAGRTSPEQPSVKLSLIRSLASQTQRLFGNGEMVDVAKILQYLYLTGEIKNYYTLFQHQDIFSDTKHTLVLAIQAAFAGDDYGATSPCDQSALDAQIMSGIQSTLTPLANMGQSFVNKMLKDTPKHIIKGLAEMMEPHVILAKMIKDVSGQVFQGMEQAEQMANLAMSLASGMTPGPLDAAVGGGVDGACNDNPTQEELNASLPAIPSQLPMSMEQVFALIQGKIDQGYPDDPWGNPVPEIMKPKISAKGLDLLGTLPYTFAIPPISPIGVIYLLLRLGDWPENLIETADCREEAEPGMTVSWPPTDDNPVVPGTPDWAEPNEED